MQLDPKHVLETAIWVHRETRFALFALERATETEKEARRQAVAMQTMFANLKELAFSAAKLLPGSEAWRYVNNELLVMSWTDNQAPLDRSQYPLDDPHEDYVGTLPHQPKEEDDVVIPF